MSFRRTSRRPGARVVVMVIVSALALAAVGSAQAATVTLVDGASPAGLQEVNKSWAARTVDYDRDGDEDVWIGYHQWTGKLWRNNGNGTYTRVAASAWPRQNSEGMIPDRHDCAWADVDLNGLADSYCSAGRNLDNRVKYGMDNELWLQGPVGQFTEVGTAWGVGDLCGRGRSVAFLDANGDPYPDLYLANETPRNVTDPCDNPANGLHQHCRHGLSPRNSLRHLGVRRRTTLRGGARLRR